jgi:phosphate transport system substrate-binding protein
MIRHFARTIGATAALLAFPLLILISAGHPTSLAAQDDSTASSGSECRLNVQGSDTMVILGQAWATRYMATRPAASVSITGGGSGTGIAALLNDTCEIAQSSRPMKPQEKIDFARKFRARPLELAVALDGLAVFVHEDNPLESITLEDLKGIYTGHITNFAQIGGLDTNITVYGRESNSGTYATFKELVLGGDDFATGTNFLAGTAAIINALTKDSSGIGYGGIAYAEGIKILALRHTGADSEPLLPTAATVGDGSYPLARPLFFAINPNSVDDCVTDFVRFVLSDEGQELVEATGYFPVAADVRAKDVEMIETALAGNTR